MQDREMVKVAERIAEKRDSEENMAIFGKLAFILLAVGLVVLFLKGPLKHHND